MAAVGAISVIFLGLGIIEENQPVVAGATTVAAQSNLKRFSTKDGFSFKYPKSFKVQKEEMPAEVVLSLLDDRQAQIIVSSSDLAGQNFKEMVGKNIAAEAGQGQTEFVKQSISDKEAVIENRVKLGPETYYSLSKLVPVAGSKVYSVVFLTPLKIFNDYRSTAEKVINSISD